MKKIQFSIFLFLLLFVGCETSSTDNSNVTFWVTDTTMSVYNESAWYQIEATKKAEGDHCIVYLENGRTVSQSTIDTFVDEFDSNIWDAVTTNFASPTDIDNNGKVILLLLDIKDDYDGENNMSYVGGYFFNVDMYTNDEIATFPDWPSFIKSNEAELLYIDISPSDPTALDTRSTIAHEFQHLVNFSQNVIAEVGNPLPTWIDEGFAMAAEAIFQDVDILEGREDWYNYDPLYSGLGGFTRNVEYSITYGYPLVVWNPYSDSTAVLNDYALSHLFFSWLRIHKKAAGDTDSFFREIMEDTDNTFQAVLNECGNLGDGSEVNTAPKMFQRFYMANKLGAKVYDTNGNLTSNGNQAGLESYLGKNSFGGLDPLPSPDSSIELQAGGARYFYSSSFNGWSPSGGNANIAYAMGDTSDFTANYGSSFGTGDSANEFLVVVNTSLDTKIKDEGEIDSSAVLPSVQYTLSEALLSNKLQLPSEFTRSTGIFIHSGAFRRGPERETLTMPKK